jgi:hypothetical protein
MSNYAYLQVLDPILPMDKNTRDVVQISSATWNTNAAPLPAYGVRPPFTETKYQQPPGASNAFQSAAVSNFKTLNVPNRDFTPNSKGTNHYELWRLQSFKDPYAAEHLVNQYGSLETRCGTQLGR